MVFAIPGVIAALAVFFTDRKEKQPFASDQELESVIE